MPIMSVFGSDKQMHAADTLKQTVRRKGFLRVRMAQTMVLLNGLILTITAFVTLNVFIDQTVTESITQTAQETRDYFAERFENLEKGLTIASGAISQSSPEDLARISDRFDISFSHADFYNGIYWLEQMSEGKYVAHVLVKPMNSDSIVDDVEGLHSFVEGHVRKDNDANQLLTGQPGVSARAGQNDCPLHLARPIKGGGHTNIRQCLTPVSKPVV